MLSICMHTLGYLYDHLSYVSWYTNKQCGGHMTLLMVSKLFYYYFLYYYNYLLMFFRVIYVCASA